MTNSVSQYALNILRDEGCLSLDQWREEIAHMDRRDRKIEKFRLSREIPTDPFKMQAMYANEDVLWEKVKDECCEIK